MDHKLTREEIEAIKNGRAALVDVRSTAELAEKKCAQAQHWDVDQMTQGRFPNIPKDQPVFVFCHSGTRSSLAQRLMSAEGFTDTHNLGGINDVPEELCQ